MKEIRELINQINYAIGSDLFGIDAAYGGYKLVRKVEHGTLDVSFGFVSRKEILIYLRAFKSGIYAQIEHGK
jgi:hypothetical protein